MEKLELEEIPKPPLPPEPDECCGSGCIRCVYDLYEEQMEKYEFLKSQIEMRNNLKLLKFNEENEFTILDTTESNTIENNNNVSNFQLVIIYNEKSDSNNCNINTLLDNNNMKIGNISSFRVLTSVESPSRAYFLDIKSNSEIQYQPGDYVSIIVPTDPSDLSKLFQRLSLDSQQEIKVKFESSDGQGIHIKETLGHLPRDNFETLYNLFKWTVDCMFIPQPFILKVMATYCQSPDDKKKLEFLASDGGLSLYKETIEQHEIPFLKLLMKFKSCQIPLEEILLYLPPKVPRKYSISSSPLASGLYHFHITFTLLKKDNDKYGICTYWMHKQIEYFEKESHEHLESFRFQIEQSKGFELPDSLSTPIVLIATGTGIAPFFSFLLHRKSLIEQQQKQGTHNPKSVGECWLFFGCKRKNWDHLYQHELGELQNQGIISRLIVSYSQSVDSTNRKYINLHLEDYSETIYKLITLQNGVLYICGNSNKIGKSSRESLINIIKKESKCTEQLAIHQLNNWKLNKQYKCDLWS
ncbi:hypothetical protein DLAC_09700 [Tieghemostelium lacteum]|uniref:FAD-binding FR-type domain-containing protein n=1 Tax=Tieghemostelium lacteum TaxID=361077 RepID=A0A151Z6Z4_TIELA|nr:hypothetical protein DLAC_09700 [Tieghemostelium lacteum]|eukprot:KYQ89732.1 hypothetical protein DLAC_09700 [Tieghemostelium lacteum]